MKRATKWLCSGNTYSREIIGETLPVGLLEDEVLIDVLASPAQSSAPAQPQADAATSADTQTHDSKISSCNIQRIQTSGKRVCVSPLRPTSEGHESNMRNRVPMIKVT